MPFAYPCEYHCVVIQAKNVALDPSRPYSDPNGDGSKTKKHTSDGNVDDSHALPMAETEIPWMHCLIAEFKVVSLTTTLQVYAARKAD